MSNKEVVDILEYLKNKAYDVKTDVETFKDRIGIERFNIDNEDLEDDLDDVQYDISRSINILDDVYQSLKDMVESAKKY